MEAASRDSDRSVRPASLPPLPFPNRPTCNNPWERYVPSSVHLGRRAEEAGVPRIGLHDLRHLAATLTITVGVPLTVVSKTLRHSTLSTTANLYSHLTQQAARDAVDTIDRALTNADQGGTRRHWPNWLRPHRDHSEGRNKRLKPSYSPIPPTSSPQASQFQGRYATTRPANTEKAAFPSLRKRPPTCENAGRDDRI
ncbi:tyrosine-type recombinase/integrase [Streptomyces sp. 7N604]|uniref:tyrosine-type recombinase/integrase n=1 Tax=Streptomyces sp. 7N604 TaxID=3457415 RepID=UPI003FD147A8